MRRADMNRQTYIRHYTRSTQDEERRRMLAKIHIEFPKLRPDLRHSTEELREARLEFCQVALGLAHTPASMGEFNNRQLGKVLDAIKAAKTQPGLPGCQIHGLRQSGGQARATVSRINSRGCDAGDMRAGSAEIIHLASEEQRWAISRIFDLLQWSEEGRARFLNSKFKKRTAAMLTAKEANSAMMILLYIAAYAALRADPKVKRVSRKMAKAYIPTLKKTLGIDRLA
jgi:hypothetical protein